MQETSFEGLICPACSTPIAEEHLAKKLECPTCKKNLKHKKYLAFLEFLMMQGIVRNLDFFDKKLYGDEIKRKEETSEELKDETDPDEFENKKERFEKYEDEMGLIIQTEDIDVAEDWAYVDDDWRDFNRKHREEDDKKNSKK